MNKVLLEPSHNHSLMYYVWLQQQSCKGVCVPTSLKYLLSDPNRKFASLGSRYQIHFRGIGKKVRRKQKIRYIKIKGNYLLDMEKS